MIRSITETIENAQLQIALHYYAGTSRSLYQVYIREGTSYSDRLFQANECAASGDVAGTAAFSFDLSYIEAARSLALAFYTRNSNQRDLKRAQHWEHQANKRQATLIHFR